MRELAVLAVAEAVAAGGAYADARAVRERTESVTVQDQRVEGLSRETSVGVGVRALVHGAWGFAATVRLDRDQVASTARTAVEVARASATARRRPVRLAPLRPTVGSWSTPVAVDPFAVSTEDKLEMLLRATAAASTVSGLAFARAQTQAWETEKWLVSSEGTDLRQRIVHVGGGVELVAVDERQVQVRSYPGSGGFHGSGGWERVLALDLAGAVPERAEQAVALLRAPALPAGVATLVLDGDQVAVQVHESIGHALELDRVLGHEAAYAGTSFVTPDDVGRLRYGSERVDVTLDGTTPGALGTYGYDDEGVPAGRHPLVTGGVLRAFLTSRETAGPAGASNGTMRADSWATVPLIRMSNIHLEPGEGTLEELLSDTGRGVLMATNRSWSIDDKRVNFQFGCEAAWDIRRGRLGRMYRNPVYTGRTTAFWGGCDAVAGASAWQAHGIPNCGKGQPPQTARVAHGAAPARFRAVQVGVG